MNCCIKLHGRPVKASAGLHMAFSKGNITDTPFSATEAQTSISTPLSTGFPELGVGLFITAGNDDAVEAVQLLKYSFINTFYEKRPVKYNHTVKIDVSGYAGTYYPSRRNFSSFEKCSIINSGINFTSDGDSLYFYSDKLNSVNENFFTNDSGNLRFIFDIDKCGDISGRQLKYRSFYLFSTPEFHFSFFHRQQSPVC